MIDLSKYRILDLSYELVPGERKIDGRYTSPEPINVGIGRYLDTQEMICCDARMHFIQGQTHIGTHAEAPYKYDENGLDIAGLPIDTFIGEAVACDFTDRPAGSAIHPEDFQQFGVQTGDIVLMWSRPDTWDNRLYLTFETIDWLIGTKIKAIGGEKMRYSPPGTPWGADDGDGRLLLAGIGLIDCLRGLQQITKPRVFFMAVPVKMQRVTAAWIRAIAFEEI